MLNEDTSIEIPFAWADEMRKNGYYKSYVLYWSASWIDENNLEERACQDSPVWFGKFLGSSNTQIINFQLTLRRLSFYNERAGGLAVYLQAVRIAVLR